MEKRIIKFKYLVHPYLYGITSFFIIMVTAAEIAMAFMMVPIDERFATKKDFIYTVITFGFLNLILFVVFYLRSYEFWGKIHIKTDRILLTAPFRKTISIYYDHIADIGIDYDTIHGHKEFWIYLSKKNIPYACVHHITKLSISSQTIRVQQREEICKALSIYLPKELKKRLLRAIPNV